MRREQNSGFTLIELSIVLVIIGLIIGGILVGRDLIEGAQIRAMISQMEKFEMSVNTFKVKYKYLPGDMPTVRAGQLGFFQLNGGGVSGYGDGNGILSLAPCRTEGLVFWRHLSEANLIDGVYGTIGNSAINPATGYVTANVTTDFERSFPPGRIGRGGYYVAWAAAFATGGGLQNYYYFIKPSSILAAPFGICISDRAPLTPIELHTIDSKVDDGVPMIGRIVALGSWSAAGVSGNCVMGGSSDIDYPLIAYNISTSTGGDVPACEFLRAFSR